jgi:hypothetical protein
MSTKPSDIISFHNYEGLPSLAEDVQLLEREQRPLLCTEWLRRLEWRKPAPELESLSLFHTHLPYFFEHCIGCY